MRSRQEDRWPSTRPNRQPRPPSVERVLAVVRGRVDGTVDPEVLRLTARRVIDDERERLRTGIRPRDITSLADAVDELL